MNPWFTAWVQFLFGTPKRTLWTVGAFVVAVLVAIPGLGEIVVNRIMIALTPFIQLAVALAVLFFGFRWLLRPSGSSGKKKKG
ncbi:MAG: hypothetical protein WC767_01595 [Candidatus Paceibacterota bacterium]|jgi:hypothetical protein